MSITRFFKKLFGGKGPSMDELREHYGALMDMLRVMEKESQVKTGHNWTDTKLTNSTTYQELKKTPIDERRNFVFELCELLRLLKQVIYYQEEVSYQSEPFTMHQFAETLLGQMMRQKLDFSDLEGIRLLEFFHSGDQDDYRDKLPAWPVAAAMIQLEKWVKKYGASHELKDFLTQMLQWPDFQSMSKQHYGSDLNKVKLRAEAILGGGKEEAPVFTFTSDNFGVYANDYLEKIEDETFRNTLCRLLALAAKAKAGKPTIKYLKQAKALIGEVDAKAYKALMWDWLEFLIKLKEQGANHRYLLQTYVTWTYLEQFNAITVKGMVWTMVHFHDAKSMDLLARLAERAYRKVPGIGQASGAIGNACIYVLAQSKGLTGISHLSRLKLKIRQANTRSLIQRYIDQESIRLNISPEEVEEISVPDFNLTLSSKTVAFGDYEAELSIIGIGKTQIQWIRPDGKKQKSAPSFIKESNSHKKRLNKLRADAKQIKTYLTAQRDRIDHSFIREREWTYDKFSAYYLDHGLVSAISRKLIWYLQMGKEKVAALYVNEQWEDVEGKRIEGISESTTISLWHPIYASIDEVLAWRNRLEDLQITQPLKQAFRELYLLTDAEVNTREYSNRMAAHILKQYQLNSLSSIRGWKYSMLGAYDDGRDMTVASRDLSWANLKAEFWINEVYDDEAIADSGIWLYVATDQVRFVREEGAVDLVDVPKMIFSEVMRDVDLFVGVASVGNDPQWRDNGGLPQYRDYWHSYSFGDLSSVAQTRKTVLEKLLPRLKIKDVARLDGRFLRVKGTLREYKIHIGSTNILMEPNDQYLCIVPSRKQENKKQVFLPFEGDNGLSVILSKAFMLAKDDKITDPTIISQLKM